MCQGGPSRIHKGGSGYIIKATNLADSYGSPWTCNGFSTVRARVKRKLEGKGAVEPGLTLKGLTHTVAMMLREVGLGDREIADLLRQKGLSMARHYSLSANLAERKRGTSETLEHEYVRGSEVVKPITRTVQP